MDSFCPIIVAIFRQIYLENELELHKKYLLESGDFYETGVKLRAMRGFLSAQALQFVTFQETSTNFTMIVTDLLNQYRGYDHAEGVRYLEYLKTELETVLVPLEEAEVRLARLEEAYRKIAEGPETRSRLYTASKSYRLSKLSHEITSLKNRIGFLKNRRDEISKNASSISSENQERLDMARARIDQIEFLVSRYREEYEKAEKELASLSFKSIHESIEEEWIQTATAFFGSLSTKYKEFERITSLKSDLLPFIRKLRGQISVLKAHLEDLEEKEKRSILLQ